VELTFLATIKVSFRKCWSRRDYNWKNQPRREVPLPPKPLDNNKQIVYITPMIQSFASAETERFFATGKSRRFPQDILKRAAMRLTQLDGATCLDDLRMPPSNRLEALAHDRAGQWSIRINDQWRVCFRFEKGDAYNVEIVDYH
jgi:proteic killer suppression protein